MPKATELKSERLSSAITPTERTALEFLGELQGRDWTTMVRDYSLKRAVREYRRIKRLASA